MPTTPPPLIKKETLAEPTPHQRHNPSHCHHDPTEGTLAPTCRLLLESDSAVVPTMVVPGIDIDPFNYSSLGKRGTPWQTPRHSQRRH
ncbi:hypothetical protein [Geotalea sp. SG265]|uniref:hypothetical protein n=1 Tax=Geotalea sp. SG265 TaxID=2922867 RepID=UPI001FAFE9BA|nr:hypothetical protein [Geotalea sp. SG265]